MNSNYGSSDRLEDGSDPKPKLEPETLALAYTNIQPAT